MVGDGQHLEDICRIHVCAHMPRFPTHFFSYTHTHTHTHMHTFPSRALQDALPNSVPLQGHREMQK